MSFGFVSFHNNFRCDCQHHHKYHSFFVELIKQPVVILEFIIVLSVFVFLIVSLYCILVNERQRRRFPPDNGLVESNFIQSFIRTHNLYRARHGVPPLKLNKALGRYSREWARKLAKKDAVESRQQGNFGENIYTVYAPDINFRLLGSKPVEVWYEQIKYYKFGQEPDDLVASQFTQVIWKDTKKVGVSVAKNRTGNFYVVAYYSPPGNVIGRYVSNVPPIKRRNEKDFISLTSSINERIVEPTEQFTQFQKDILHFHNLYRETHQVPKLVLSRDLSRLAQQWADHCALKKSLKHRPKNQYGENIYYTYSPNGKKPTAKDVVREWYNEILLYDAYSSKINPSALHFTQLIWKSSKRLGVGIATNINNQTFVVANYDPKGNIQGEFPGNVPMDEKFLDFK